MPITRRQLLQSGAMTLMAAASPLTFASPSRALNGQLLALTTVSPENRTIEATSILKIDLASGIIEAADLPDHRFGHKLVPLPDGGYFAVPYGDDDVSCLFLDKELNIRGELHPPENHGFGGHAALLPDNKYLFVHFNHSGYGESLTPEETGKFSLVNIESMKPEVLAPSGVLHGHDIILSRDKRSIIVGDDGVLSTKHPSEPEDAQYPYGLHAHDPALVSFPIGEMAAASRQPLPINGCLVHLVQDRSHRVYGAVEQYVGNNPDGLATLKPLIEGQEAAYVERLDTDSFIENLPLPGPIVSVDLASGEVKREEQVVNLAPFDIGLNELTGRVINAFTGSHSIGRYTPETGSWDYFSTADWGIEQPRGIIDIPGTSLMAVNGFWSGVAVFDVNTMEPVRVYKDDLHGVKHLTYAPA